MKHIHLQWIQKTKKTGAKRREKIYFSINDIANPDLAFSQLFGHEKAHMNTYDEGKYGEETSIHTREKIGSENKNKVFTEEEKADYLNNLRNKYKNEKSIEQQFAEAKLVPEKDKEHWFDEKTYNEYINKKSFTQEELNYLTKKYKVDKEEIRKNPKKYIYYETIKKKEKHFKNEKELLEYMEKNPKEGYKEISDSFAQLHNIFRDSKTGEWYIDTTFPNRKYTNNFGEEVVVNKKTGEIVRDNVNNATYNVGAWQGKDKLKGLSKHFEADVSAWEEFGVNEKDPTTKEDRKILSSLSKLYYWDSNFQNYCNYRGQISLSVYKDYEKLSRSKLGEGE